MRPLLLFCVGAALLPAGCLSAPPASPTAADLLAEGDAAFRGRDYCGATELFLTAIDRAEEEGDMTALTEVCVLAANGHFVRDEVEAGGS